MNQLIRDFVIEQLLDGREISNDENLLLSGLVDSLGVMQLVRFLETQFDVQVPAEDVTIEHFMTIEAITTYIGKRV